MKCEYCEEEITGIPVKSLGKFYCNTDCWEGERGLRAAKRSVLETD